MKHILLCLLLAVPMIGQQDKPWVGNSTDIGGKVECGGCTDLKPTGTVTPHEEFRAEPLTPEEVKELTAAQEQLQRVEQRIRAAHGEFSFRMGELSLYCSAPATYSTVELRQGWALISTHPCPSIVGW